MRYPITFVSLGPGDPELITLKGLKTLREADIIYAPATISNGELSSRAKEIISVLGVDLSKVETFVVPMSRMREVTLEMYAHVATNAHTKASEGIRVAISAEGDAGFYSSAQYIEEMLWAAGATTDRIAGVPAFVDCARLAHTHIVSQDSSFEVISRVDSCEVLELAMKQDKSIVLMKISQWEQPIKTVIQNATNHIFHYIESCGVEGKEFYTSDNEVILNRKFPYFAILIIKQKR